VTENDELSLSTVAWIALVAFIIGSVILLSAMGVGPDQVQENRYCGYWPNKPCGETTTTVRLETPGQTEP